MKTPEMNSSDFNRRDFLKGGSFATLATLLGGVQLVAQQPPAEAPTAYGTGPAFTVKCAIIGLGNWGREVVATLARLKEAEITAICDNYAPALKRAANSAPKAKQVADYKEILADKEIQGVIIATPSHLHKEIALAAIKAGKHVYCEAPLAASIEDAREIALAARANPKIYFQSGLQTRSEPQRHFLLPFIRAGAWGTPLMARAQWHKKTSWRATSPNAERDKALNWRLSQETSPGLAGELGIHQLDAASWFLKGLPKAVTGFGGVLHWKDGRDVADTVQAVLEYREGVTLSYDATLGNSFDADYEMYYGTDAAVMIRENKAWMFKEVDSPLLGWEVYARKDMFYKETGIALVANATKLVAQGSKPAEEAPYSETPLRYALEAFLNNTNEVSSAVEDFLSTFSATDTAALQKHLSQVKLSPAATYKDGYEATVVALKTNEAIVKGGRVSIDKSLYNLA
jgi:predicted dehydrogenase